MSTNLATFEQRLKSLSDETDGLIETSPTQASPRRNSVDEILEMRRLVVLKIDCVSYEEETSFGFRVSPCHSRQSPYNLNLFP